MARCQRIAVGGVDNQALLIEAKSKGGGCAPPLGMVAITFRAMDALKRKTRIFPSSIHYLMSLVPLAAELVP
jgi:hypothetical protein